MKIKLPFLISLIPLLGFLALLKKLKLVGTVDMSAKGVHEQSGQPIVHTTIIASIYDIKGRIPKVVTTLRPITNKGMGQDQSLAKKAALDRTAKSAVSEIIDKLRVKGLL